MLASPTRQQIQVLRVYPYGVGRGRLIQAAQNLGVAVTLVDALDQANVVVTLKNHYRKHPQPVADAERRRIPVYVFRANTLNQVEACLGDIFGVSVQMEDPVDQRDDRDARGHRPRALWLVLGGSAASFGGRQADAARYGTLCQSGFAQLWQ